MQVLIIEQSYLIVERIKELLLENGVVNSVCGCSSYKESIGFIISKAVDVVIINSIQYNEEIESIIKKVGTNIKKIIVLLNDEDKHVQQKLMNAGATYLLDKYNDYLQLPNIIQAIKNNTSNVTQQSA
jgi:DNA-binding NarL/FixJ family response regulator